MTHDTLIICYTRSGTTAVAAKQISKMMGCRIGWLRDVEVRLDWLGKLRCALEGLLGLGAPYIYRGPRPGRYRHVVVMGPVWMGGMASPLRRFLIDTERSRDPYDRLPPSVSCIYLTAAPGSSHAVEQTSRLLSRPLYPALTLHEQLIWSEEVPRKLTTFAHDVENLEHALKLQAVRPQWLSANAS